MKKKTAKKKTSAHRAARKKAPAKKPAKKRAPEARRLPKKKKKTVPRGGTRTTPPEPMPERMPRGQPVPPGNERAPLREPPRSEPPRVAAGDQHGPMHLPSNKPAPAYADMTKRDWAGRPPVHNIPIPKK